MKAIKLELGNPAAFDAVINVVVNNGYLTINCASVTGTSTAIISIIKVTEDPTAITSTEFDILANRISHMTTLFEVTLDSVTNTSGSYTHTTTVAGMTSDLKCVKLECSDPTIFRDTVDITSGSDSVTLTCSNVVGSSTVKASFLSVGNGNPLSSSEYAALDTRIGQLADLDTTDKTDIVSAINEVNTILSGKYSIRMATHYITPAANQYVQPYTHFAAVSVTLNAGESIIGAFAQNGGGVPKPVGIVQPDRVTVSSMSTEQLTIYVYIASAQ